MQVLKSACLPNFNKHTGRIQNFKPTGEIKPLGRSKRRCEDSIRIDLKEIGVKARNCVDSTKDKDYCRGLVNAALNLRIP